MTTHKYMCHDGDILKNAVHLAPDYLRKDQEDICLSATFCSSIFYDMKTTHNVDEMTCPNCELFLEHYNDCLEELAKMDKYALLDELCILAAGNDHDGGFTPWFWAMYRYAYERMKGLL